MFILLEGIAVLLYFRIIFLFWELCAKVSRSVIMKHVVQCLSVRYFKWQNVNDC